MSTGSINGGLFKRIQNYLQIDHYDMVKLLFGAITFFFIIAAYSILRSLKTSIFLAFVGREYEPISKILSIFFIIPAMMILAKITDLFKRHQVVYCFIGFYTILIIIFAVIFAHPAYGILNTQTSPYRFTGWAFEITMDLFQALIVGTFWSFLNSISTPASASKLYGFIVAGSRFGGMLAAFMGWTILEKKLCAGHIAIPMLTASAGLFLLIAVMCIHAIKNRIPTSHLRGYEASYIAEHKAKPKTNIFEGLKLILFEPYLFGIFVMVFSFELINIIFDYQMHVLMSLETHNQVTAMSSYMLLYTGTFQMLSLFFALFGTSTLLKRIGLQASLLIMPLACVILAVLPLMFPSLLVFFIIMVILRALNYGFNHPLREMLFIPTSKDINFKSKAWIDSFGRSLPKTTGSTFNYAITYFKIPYLCLLMSSGFSLIIAVVWSFTAFLVGKKYLKTVKSNEVIGKSNPA